MVLLAGASVFSELISFGDSLIQLAAACVGLASAVLLRREVHARRHANNENEHVADSLSERPKIKSSPETCWRGRSGSSRASADKAG